MSGIFYILTPFSYIEVSGVRLILAQILLGIILLAYSLIQKSKIYANPTMASLFLLLVITLIYSGFTGHIGGLLSLFVFMVLMYCAYHVAARQKFDTQKIKNLYMLFVCCFRDMDSVFDAHISGYSFISICAFWRRPQCLRLHLERF